VVLMSLESAISDLQTTLAGARSAANWRWVLRQRLSAMRQALGDEDIPSWDGWLAARTGTVDRERRQLLARISAIGAGLLDRLETESAATEVQRLLNDVERYRQRIHDLLYDSVAMEIGGSE
jgi:recombinational DNA repair ATPase RecF